MIHFRDINDKEYYGRREHKTTEDRQAIAERPC